MNNKDFTLLFLFLAFFNTNLGLSNVEKNDTQFETQKRIEEKLDKILEILKDE